MLPLYVNISIVLLINLFEMNYECCLASEVAHDFVMSVFFAILFHQGEFNDTVMHYMQQ